MTRIAKAIAALAVAAFLVFVGSSFFKTAAAVDDYIPKSWNAAIEKLGITPLYPPQEDVFVTDIVPSKGLGLGWWPTTSRRPTRGHV
ncbi:hypothetical protein CPY51_29835 [Rhizobium tubonense]|uniref:Uncharacterized protein n=1 Tax=Rhizobium tubonense TaxID=484088 RepID=A0A2W4C4H2_9HYPH|nr:hypothetical protein CPY51_29835 [Rhizobium tubonense]